MRYASRLKTPIPADTSEPARRWYRLVQHQFQENGRSGACVRVRSGLLAPNPEPTEQPDNGNPKAYAGSDESPDIGAVQRFHARFAQIIQQHHRSRQRQN
jgi:hypothetical protein